jgi:tetratricopeptide (TPR) repeat protein
VAEILARAGWDAGAFVSSAVLDSAFGLARGFRVYDDRMSGLDEEGAAEPPQRRGDATTDAALAWLHGAREPFLGWIHYYDPHSTYDPPEPWKSSGLDPYDGEIAFMDAQIGRVLAALEARGVLEHTLVVAVADHGESLGEHGESTHGLFVYDATMRVPLIVAGPGVAARVATTTAEVADLAATILAATGVAGDVGGTSLAPVLAGRELASRAAYGESEYGWLAFGWSPLRTLTRDGWRYIHSSAPELYDRARDPGEVNDVAARERQRAADLDRELHELRGTFRPRGTSAAAVDEDLAARLSSLGYAQSIAESGRLPDDLPAPRAMVAVHEEFSRAVGYAQHGQPERAIPLLERATAAWPRGAQFHLQLGIALHQAGRSAEAEAPLARALALDPKLELAQYFLGLTRTAQGDPEGAIAAFDRALALQPAGYLPLTGKAWALVQLGREAEAAEVLRVVVERKPKHVTYALSLARALRNLGRSSEAVAVLARAHAERPDDAGLALYYAWELATNPDDAVRDGRRAVSLAEAALVLRGRANPDDLDTLAAALAEAGRHADAVRTLDEALRAAGDGADPALVAEWRARRELYAAQRAFRDG